MVRTSTQQFLEFDQIREGVIILKNKGLRGILMASSLNFALLPQEEQDAITYLYQDFLNSLDFPIQIYIQSRKLNLTGYLDQIKALAEKQTNELLKAQTVGYYKFIKQLVTEGTIMTKSFYIVIPFTLADMGLKAGRKGIINLTESLFQKAKTQLFQRMEFVALGLKRLGIRAIPLTTAEIIELFWAMHHPQEMEVGYFPEIPPELTSR